MAGGSNDPPCEGRAACRDIIFAGFTPFRAGVRSTVIRFVKKEWR